MGLTFYCTWKFLNVLKISSDFCHEAEILSLDFIVKAALQELLYLCSKGINFSVFIKDTYFNFLWFLHRSRFCVCIVQGTLCTNN